MTTAEAQTKYPLTQGVNPWLVTCSVMLPTFMEVLDTAIASVALPYIAGSLSATNSEATWVLTSYLVANAVKFTDTGGRVDVAAALVDGCLSISVSDTGIGMKPEDIPLALAPFQQLESAWDRKYQGTGLGLPLPNALIALHGGSLLIESELGIGTTVTAHFPAERTVERPVDRLH